MNPHTRRPYSGHEAHTVGDGRLPSLPRTSPLLYTPVYFVPLYLPLYLHCIQTWAGYIVSQCIHRHPPLYLTSRSRPLKSNEKN